MKHDVRSPVQLDSAAPPIEGLSPFAGSGQLDRALTTFLASSSQMLCEWIAAKSDHGPLPRLSVLLDAAPEPIGRDADGLLADLRTAMEGAYQPHHPGALAHLDPPPLTSSLAAELIAAGLNNNLLAEELAPSLSRLERGVCTWMARRLGFPEGSGGVAASGGTLSTLNALVCARRRQGLQSRADAVIVASEEAHVSLAKAAAVMGLAADGLVSVPTDGEGRLCVDALSGQLAALEQTRRPVIAVVATAGTTVRGAVDPLGAIAGLCRERQLWFHIDGAIGAVFGLSRRERTRVPGLAMADSLTVNPQKLLGISKTSSLLLLRDPAWLREAFQTGLPYMEPSWGGGHGGECGLQGSRPAEVLKLWLGLRQLGLDGIEAVLRGALERRRTLERQLDATSLQIAGGPLHLLAVTPRHLPPEGAERWAEQTRRVLLERHLMLSRPHYRGRSWLKAVLGNPYTDAGLLTELAELLNRSALSS
ncbi:aspartate aminotransferase family protein [Synechococcus sp. RSCCF101]|uniref:pyridoxal phosphate-dependent decarboxylase family protein n=1 Tax=Synechococcus sp. RSCCF101 TaxID=2511069 RepID=UPI0012469F68|nr:pyridoxal-dependent decarboxylase [Synechococcus sp. RSCCF101]QEY33355.1 aspartate aminotransferase family protein [Synechococcus sp. RSCCF101]